jgi:hypothetical protein
LWEIFAYNSANNESQEVGKSDVDFEGRMGILHLPPVTAYFSQEYG